MNTLTSLAGVGARDIKITVAVDIRRSRREGLFAVARTGPATNAPEPSSQDPRTGTEVRDREVDVAVAIEIARGDASRLTSVAAGAAAHEAAGAVVAD